MPHRNFGLTPARRSIAFHMANATVDPPRDRRHAALNAMMWLAAVLSVVGLAAIAVHQIGEGLLP